MRALGAPTSRRLDQLEADQLAVGDLVATFRTRLRESFRDALQRSGRYRTLVVAILEEEGLPSELSYLPLIESSYRIDAVSHAGAVGPWQFIRATGRQYGLRIDAYVDERRDPEHSTRAAARYLRDLYRQFRSWHLALAAYNVGPGRIARALSQREAAPGRDLSARGALPRAAGRYVARFAATLQIARVPQQHGFAHPTDVPLEYDVVVVRGSLSHEEVAAMVGATAADIAALNPALVKGRTPPGRRGYGVRVPKGAKAHFEVADARMGQRLAGL